MTSEDKVAAWLVRLEAAFVRVAREMDYAHRVTPNPFPPMRLFRWWPWRG